MLSQASETLIRAGARAHFVVPRDVPGRQDQGQDTAPEIRTCPLQPRRFALNSISQIIHVYVGIRGQKGGIW